MLPHENFLSYESACEAVGDHHNHAKFMANGLTVTQEIHRMVVSRSPFPLESASVHEALPQNCLLGAADLSALCLRDMKQ